MARRASRIAVGVLLLVVAVPAVAYGYLAWIAPDPPEPARLDEAGPTSGGPDRVDGDWVIAEVSSNYAGYRIRERMGPVTAPSDAVGRTPDVTGSLRIEGGELTALSVNVTMSTLSSDSSRRDELLQTTALETDTYPRASFDLTEPVRLDRPTRGREIAAQVAGSLELHGVTRPVAFDVQARWDGPVIQVAGSTQVELDAFDITVAAFAGFRISGSGTIEFEVTFVPLGGDVEVGAATTLVDRPASPTPGDEAVPCPSAAAVTLATPLLYAGAGGQAVVVDEAGAASVIDASPTGPLGLSGVSWAADGQGVVGAIATREGEATFLASWSDGGELIPLGPSGGVADPHVNAAGEVVYVRDGDVWVADGEGSAGRLLVETPGHDRAPVWSPDGSLVAFTTVAVGVNEEVMVVRRDGTARRVLASSPGYEYAPSFTPDGDAVVFVRDGAVRRVSLDGGEVASLTDGPNDANPALSPDGSQLAFVRDGTLHVARADGGEPRCVPATPPVLAGPMWRP